MNICPNCNKPLKENAKFCTFCGTKILSDKIAEEAENILKCSCGTIIKPNAKFCTACGKPIESLEAAKSNINDNLCSCGAKLKQGAKFCTSCGKKVESKKENIIVLGDFCSCGAELKLGAKFCTKCGKAVLTKQPSAPEISTISTSQHTSGQIHASSGIPIATTPKKKKRGFIKAAAAILIVAVVGGGGYLAYDKFFGGVRKKLLIEQKIPVSDKDQTVKYQDEISVTVPWGLIDKEQTLSIYSVKGLPKEEGLKQLGAYDINMSDMSEFDGFIEITIKYNPADLPAGTDTKKDLFCMYLDEKTNEWKGVPYVVNPSNNTITIYTNHFSTFSPWIVTNKVERGPMMRIANVKFPGGAFMSTEEVERTMEKYASSSPKSDGAMMEGWSKVNEWFGIESNVSTFVEHALEFKSLEGVNAAATEVGLGFALVQCALDITDGKTGKATLELSKNLYQYWSSKFINTSALSLAFVGVFVIDWSLNKFIQEAISGRTDIYQQAYDLYYKEKRQKENINTVYWYKKLKKAMKTANNPNTASEDVTKVIRDYVWEFWNDESVVAEYQSRVMRTGATGGGYLNEELKQNISNAHFASIIRTLNETNIFERIVKETRLDMQSKLYDKLCYIKNELNKVNKIQVILKKDPECNEYNDVDISGVPIHFDVSADAHKKLWIGKTDKDGEFLFNCTTLGYIDAGAPHEAIATVKGPAGKEEEFSGELKLAGEGKTSVIEIIIGAPKLEGTWKLDATIVKMTLDASLQYMDQMADFYGSGDDYRKERKKVEDQMKGQKAQLPDLKLDGIEYIMDVKREGQYYVIQSKNFNDNTALGSVQYKIRFTGKNSFEGTYIGLNHLNGKENRTEMDIKGTRIK